MGIDPTDTETFMLYVSKSLGTVVVGDCNSRRWWEQSFIGHSGHWELHNPAAGTECAKTWQETEKEEEKPTAQAHEGSGEGN